jgi:hypothetical protein
MWPRESGSRAVGLICLPRAVLLSSTLADFPLKKGVLSAAAVRPDMELFIGRMAQVACYCDGR